MVGPRRQKPTLLIRPVDLVVLEVSWIGLRKGSNSKGPILSRISSDGSAYLIVWFPPQNLAEKSYFISAAGMEDPTDPSQENPEPPPIDALIADDSRLVFKVPIGTSVQFSVAGILEACRTLEMAVPANALPPKRKLIITAYLPEAILTGTAISYRTTDSRFGGLIAASRARSAVLTGLIGAEASDAFNDVFAANRTVQPERRSRTIEGVLGTERVGAVLHPEAIEIIRHGMRLRPRPALPSETQTAIETPFRLIVSPNRLGAWAHADQPVERDGRVELWHTRLGVRASDGSVDEDSSFYRTIRAVWARGRFGEDSADSPPAFDPNSFDFRMTLDDFDRHNIVHLSSNFGISLGKRYYEPEAVDVDKLFLTSLGSWMDVHGSWNPEPEGLSVEEWIHRGTVGRDHYVKVVYSGFLVPFGHRASLVKVTERRFHDALPGRTAYLRERMYIAVKEPEKNYTNSGLTFGGSKNLLRSMPLRSVRITSLVTPDLDNPSNSDINVNGSAQNRMAFWPQVLNSPFMWKMTATDVGLRTVEFEAPLIWIDKTITDGSLIQDVIDAYQSGQGLGGTPSVINLSGQSVTYAPAGRPDDTTFDTVSLDLGAEKITAVPKFHPRMRTAKLDIPALKQIAGSKEASTLEYHDAFLQDGFTGANKGEVLFGVPATANKVAVNFAKQSDKSGGLAAPNLAISGVSRLLGPVSGDAAKAATGQFDPAAFFKNLDAKIFGVIDLVDILEELPFFDDLGKAPRFISQALNDVEQFLDDLERLEQLMIEAGNGLWTAVEAQVDAVADEIADLMKGAGTGTLSQRLTALKTAIDNVGAMVDGAPIPAGMRQQIRGRLDSISKTLGDIAGVVAIVEQFVNGFELPKSLRTRFEWRPRIGGWPSGPVNNQIFRPQPDSLVLSVEAVADTGGGDPAFNVSAALENFGLHLIAPATVLIIPFDKLEFRVAAGKKPEIDVVMGDIQFVGALSFIQTIRELIPFDIFSDPPAVEVDASGITAGATLALPNISVGVFSLENLSLGAGFTIPFIGDPLSVWFKFCDRENPALVSVSLFGGGFFFGVTLDPGGLRIFEASIEFGANVSMDFGVASGGVSVMAGIYFKLENNTDATLTGYFRARGHVSVLGIISVTIELYLELTYEFASGKCVGRASLKIEIELFLFSISVTIEAEKKFAGGNGDPTFADVMSPYALDPGDPSSPMVDPWEEYCVAFA